MAFTFDPNTDYYSLFEACMADGTTEALNDPEDFDEFLQVLKDGRYDPDAGISPAPLTEEQKEKLLKEIADTCEVNTGWFSDHDACAYWFALTGEFHEDTDRMLGEFAEYIYTDVLGRTIEASEYLPVAKQYCRQKAADWLRSETPEERADFFYWSRQRFWEKGWSHIDANAAFGKNNPDWKPALWEWYSNNKEERIDFLYELFDSTQLLVLFAKEISDNAVSIAAVLNDAGDDLTGCDEMVAQLFIRGGAIDGKVISDAAFLKLVAAKEEQKQKAIEEGKRRYAEQQQKIKQDAAAAAKERKEMKAARNLEDIFNDAVNDCNFDEVFSDADDFREMIEANIEEIAANFCEGNEFCPTGDEPTWLVPALLKAGAEVG